MTAKRTVDEAGLEDDHESKRPRRTDVDHLSRLSNELVLRILALLPPSQLVICQRLSRKYHALGRDSALWRDHYFNRFVRPRSSRLPGLKNAGTSNSNVRFSARASKWLDEQHLLERGANTDWKQQYKLRHNWTRGICAVDEISVAEQPRVPPLVVQMHDGIIFIADQTDGLRAWSAKGDRKLLAQTKFAPTSGSSPPTSLAVDDNSTGTQVTRVAIAFEDGSFTVYALEEKSRITQIHCQHSSGDGVIVSIALVSPYVLTMTATQRLSLFDFTAHCTKREGTSTKEVFEPPKLVHSLKSHTAYPPLSLSLRQTAQEITIAIAYALPTYLSGWTVGVQEIKLSGDGGFTHSRTASAIEEHYRPLAFAAPPMMAHLSSNTAGLGLATNLELRQIHSKPTSLSYTHPYLLVSHPDNTLTLYLVSSSVDSLSIGAGSRLWGHTSSISGAHVGGRGKAVSVSRRGDELRVWELEGGFGSSTARKRLAGGDLSVRVRPSVETRQAGLDVVNRLDTSSTELSEARDVISNEQHELTITRGWIGFDEENVVVLKEESHGKQALMIYDFT